MKIFFLLQYINVMGLIPITTILDETINTVTWFYALSICTIFHIHFYLLYLMPTS